MAFPGAPTFSGFGWALHNFGRRGCVCFGFDFLAYFQPKNGVFWYSFLACSTMLDAGSIGIEV